MISPVILGSGSPRRQFLLREIGFDFRIIQPNVDESFPTNLRPDRVPLYLARKKAEAITVTHELVITADTVVILGDRIFNKPAHRAEAIDMLTDLSGRTHRVVTGVCLRLNEREKLFAEESLVTFLPLSTHQITQYIDIFQPFDKAGAYGAQDSLPSGYNPCSEQEILFLESIQRSHLVQSSITTISQPIVLIEKIQGSYFNVMGLPIQSLYDEMRHFL
jgi:septum formation protein